MLSDFEHRETSGKVLTAIGCVRACVHARELGGGLCPRSFLNKIFFVFLTGFFIEISCSKHPTKYVLPHIFPRMEAGCFQNVLFCLEYWMMTESRTLVMLHGEVCLKSALYEKLED